MVGVVGGIQSGKNVAGLSTIPIMIADRSTRFVLATGALDAWKETGDSQIDLQRLANKPA